MSEKIIIKHAKLEPDAWNGSTGIPHKWKVEICWFSVEDDYDKGKQKYTGEYFSDQEKAADYLKLTLTNLLEKGTPT